DADRVPVQVHDPAGHPAPSHAGAVRVHEEPLGGAQGGVALKPEYVGLLSLVVLFGAIFIGFPIAFTLIAVALGIGYLSLGDLALHLMTLQFFSVMRDPTLASV